MKKLINCFFKGIFATVMIAITGQLYWNFYIVEKFGIGKVVEDSSVFIIGAAVLYSIFALLTGRKDEELKQTYEIQTKTIKDLVEENKKLEKKLKVSISVRGKLLNKLSSLHRLVKNLEPTGDLMKQYQEFILTPKREHDAIKDEEMMKEGV